MESIWQAYKGAIIAVGILLALVFSSMVIVPETQQAVVIRTGEPVRTINRFKPDVPFGQTGAGVAWRVPLIEQVQMVDRRVLDLDMERQQVLSNDQ